ncbi:MAG: hypothetical protein HC824_19550 [Synechococcales cyanobacterium RM1_1_8]|nr:hypothetical protein [Synechococcales cyanobacterium RM1_1_8]
MALGILALPSISLGIGLAQPVLAQPAYGSYIGGGLGLGYENQDNGQLDATGVISARYKFLKSPFSARAQVLLDRDSIAVVPTVSYDIPVSWQLEPYIGGGVAFASNGSIIGDKTSFVLQPGVDYAIPNTKLVIFGNALVAFDAYDGGDKDGGTAVSIQTGVGWQF